MLILYFDGVFGLFERLGRGGGGVVRSEHQVNIGSMIGYLLGIELVFQNKIFRV